MNHTVEKHHNIKNLISKKFNNFIKQIHENKENEDSNNSQADIDIDYNKNQFQWDEQLYSVEFNYNQSKFIKQQLNILTKSDQLKLRLFTPTSARNVNELNKNNIMNEFKSVDIIDMNLVFQESNEQSKIKFLNIHEFIYSMQIEFRTFMKKMDIGRTELGTKSDIKKNTFLNTINKRESDLLAQQKDEQEKSKNNRDKSDHLFMFEQQISLFFENLENKKLDSLNDNIDMELMQLLEKMNEQQVSLVVNQNNNIFRIRFDDSGSKSVDMRWKFNNMIFNVFKCLVKCKQELFHTPSDLAVKTQSLSRPSSPLKFDTLINTPKQQSPKKLDNSHKRQNTINNQADLVSEKQDLEINEIHMENMNKAEMCKDEHYASLDPLNMDAFIVFTEQINTRVAFGACKINDTQNNITIDDMDIRNYSVKTNKYACIQQFSIKLDQNQWQCVRTFANLKLSQEWCKQIQFKYYANDKWDMTLDSLLSEKKSKNFMKKTIVNRIHKTNIDMSPLKMSTYEDSSIDYYQMVQMIKIDIAKLELSGHRFILLNDKGTHSMLIVDIFNDCTEVQQKLQSIQNEEKCTIHAYFQGRSQKCATVLFKEINNFKTQCSNQFYQDDFNHENYQSKNQEILNNYEQRELYNILNKSGSTMFRAKNKVDIRGGQLIQRDEDQFNKFNIYWTKFLFNKQSKQLNPLNYLKQKSLFEKDIYTLLLGDVNTTSHMSLLLHLDKSMKSIQSQLVFINDIISKGGQQNTGDDHTKLYAADCLLMLTPLLFNLDNDLIFKLPVFPLPAETLNKYQRMRLKKQNGDDIQVYIDCNQELVKIGSTFKIAMQIECYKLVDQSEEINQNVIGQFRDKIFQKIDSFRSYQNSSNQSEKESVRNPFKQSNSNKASRASLGLNITNDSIHKEHIQEEEDATGVHMQDTNNILNMRFSSSKYHSDAKRKVIKTIKYNIFRITGSISVDLENSYNSFTWKHKGKLNLRFSDHVDYEFSLPDNHVSFKNNMFYLKQIQNQESVTMKTTKRQYEISKLQTYHSEDKFNQIHLKIKGWHTHDWKFINLKSQNELTGNVQRSFLLGSGSSNEEQKKIASQDQLQEYFASLTEINVKQKGKRQEMILPTDSTLRDDYKQFEHGNDKQSQKLRSRYLDNLKRDEFLLKIKFE